MNKLLTDGVSCTRINESFDHSKHVVELLVDQHVVHLNSDVLNPAQLVGHRLEFTSKATARVRATNFPVNVKWRD